MSRPRAVFVFKVQANMDPNHRDRIAFVRLCFGEIPPRHEAVQCAREEADQEHSGDDLLLRPEQRETIDEAFPGDIIGIPNHGTLHVGDSLTEGEALQFVGIPNFAPEILRRVVLEDAMRAKQLNKALQRSGRGGRRADLPPGRWVMADPWRGRRATARRVDLAAEGRIRPRSLVGRQPSSRSPAGSPRTDPKVLAKFISDNGLSIADDLDGDPVYLARNDFYLGYTRDRSPGIAFTDVKDRHAER